MTGYVTLNLGHENLLCGKWTKSRFVTKSISFFGKFKVNDSNEEALKKTNSTLAFAN